MKKFKPVIILFSLLIYYFLSSCQPRASIRHQPKAEVDSSLYFQQVDIDDPFLDTIFQNPTQSISLSKEIYPPPPPKAEPPKFKGVEGFRVQIFAGLDSINALSAQYLAKNMVTDSIYIFNEKGLFKIQVGDYQFRPQADAAKTKFRQNGFPGAWVVQRSILIPIDLSSFEDDKNISENDIEKQVSQETAGKYRVQIAATISEEKARLLAADLRNTVQYNVFYEKSGNLFKIFAGSFQYEEQARKALKDIREAGFQDAWLVY